MSRRHVRGNRRFGGGVTSALIASVLFGTAGDVYASAANDFSAVTPGTVRVRFRVETVPTTGFKWIAGFSAGSTGWLVCTEDAVGGASAGQLVCYVGADAALKRVGRKFLVSEQIGQVVTVHVVFDSVGGKLRWYLDGYEIGDGYVSSGFGTSYTSYDLPSAALGIGSRSDGLYTTPQSVVEVAMSSAIMGAADVLADAQKGVGTSMTSETHRWTASASVGATWTADTGAVNLTRTGTPAVQSVASSLLKTRRTFNVWGDSVAAGRQSGGTTGDGWRRTVQKSCAGAGKGISIVGTNVPSGTYNIDFDYWSNATGGESLNTRLATLAADLANTGSTTTGVVLAYGLNDIIALGRTAAQLAADVQTACGTIDTARPGAPVVVCNIYDVAAGSATAPQHAEIQSYISGFSAMISTLQGLGYNVAGADYSGVVTDPDDTAQLYDGTHPTPTIYTSIGNVIATSIQSLI